MTVVTVTWNTLEYLRTLVSAVQAFSPPDVRLYVVDNHSNDGTKEWLRGIASESIGGSVRSVRLQRNVGHALGLHVGLSAVQTEYFVLLDVDAFPIRPGWLTTLLGPLSNGALLVGADVNGFAHPCCVAGRTEWFFRRPRTLSPSGVVHESSFYDVGERVSAQAREEGEIALLPVTRTLGPGYLGAVFGDAVYHNFYSAHEQGDEARDLGQTHIRPRDVADTWARATVMYLPHLAHAREEGESW